MPTHQAEQLSFHPDAYSVPAYPKWVFPPQAVNPPTLAVSASSTPAKSGSQQRPREEGTSQLKMPHARRQHQPSDYAESSTSTRQGSSPEKKISGRKSRARTEPVPSLDSRLPVVSPWEPPHPRHLGKARNAFILFRSDFQAQEVVPKDIENQRNNISRIAGSIWQGMTLAQRAPWVEKAERERRWYKERG
ncbi:hypothetical protein EVG20_g7328 [Dentipellis fragilis]|uniref:HMG box domain-containing protein n=1 Tax=Dentipellis fragilis TaxID=205917 RepID=A0A4Y9YG65_9AGAM|nr:hypothetical protein EVG20_g7328 [Dentipellis fragilis]